jgi:hypothetical protein
MLERASVRIAVASVLALGAAGCGGGGGGGGGSGGKSGFILTDVKYGRKVTDASGSRLVSPLTTASTDPTSGLLIPGTLLALDVSVNVNAPQSLGLGPDYLPRVVPRNGLIALEFSQPVDPASVSGDVIDAGGNLVTAGSVQVRTQADLPVLVEVTLASDRVIWIDPVTPQSVGLPPSPIDFGPGGEPRADATGFLRIVVPRTGNAILRAAGGTTFLGQRSDKLGEVGTPIGINPGNAVLDFVAQNELIPTNETFNGFLPDLSAPRIVRTYSYPKTLSFALGDGGTATTLTDAAANFSTAARGGLGEWAGGQIVLRPGTPSEETKAVAGNTQTVVTIVGAFALPPQDGDDYRLERTELFEVDLAHPIDPLTFDPDNPENANNTQLARFVNAYEIDPQGNVIAGPTDLRQAVPAFSELHIRFTEPMSAESFLPWETCLVSLVANTSYVLYDVKLDPTQTQAILRPIRLDQQAGTFEVVGWGKASKNMALTLVTLPKPSFLQQNIPPADLPAFLDQGVRGITDAGGQPLAYAPATFDPSSPPIIYSTGFTSTEASMTQVPPPVISSWGVTVHKMQGRPISGIDPATGKAGVGFRDQPNFYRPIGDVNLKTNGYLAGSPVVYSTKVHDDFFPPPHGQFGKFPFGVPEPLATPNDTTSTTPPPGPFAHRGARFQVVWRDIDCSPSRDALAGTLLDLYRVSWAPIGGNVTTDNYDNVSVHCAHSPLRPITTQNGAGANSPYSGLGQPFDWAAWLSLTDSTPDACAANCFLNTGPNYWDTLVTCVQPGTKYKVAQSNLFTPPGDANPFHPWPVFDTRFQYNNGDIPQEELDLRDSVDNHKCSGTPAWQELRNSSSNPDYDNSGGDSLLFEVRIRPQTTTVSRQNGFTMAIGILLSPYPKFRVLSMGTEVGGNLDPDPLNGDTGAICAIYGNDSPQNDVPNGDNSRYFGAFDYVKTTSRINSPWVRVEPGSTTSPNYFPVILYPPLASQPPGTSTLFEFEGADGISGIGGTGFGPNLNAADNKRFLAFKATLVGNLSTLLLPNYDTVAIPFLRPFGS